MEKEKNYILSLHKCFDNYLCKLTLPSENSSPNIKNLQNTHMIIILDISGSMGNMVQRFCREIIPSILTQLYSDFIDYKITLITFASQTYVYKGNSEILKTITNIKPGGCTYMQPALEQLLNIILDDDKKVLNYRILSLSDGELHDQEKTVNSADVLKNMIKDKHLIVNSQAIRLFTSEVQPDTRGLSSMIQLSTKGNQMLVDINCSEHSNENIVNLICDMFSNDGLFYSYSLQNTTGIKNLRDEPWNDYTDIIYLFPGENTFWVKSENENNIITDLEKSLKIVLNDKENIKINCEIKEVIDISNYQELIKDKIPFYFKQLKLFKIVNTTNSLSKIDSIIDFFDKLENSLYINDLKPNTSDD